MTEPARPILHTIRLQAASSLSEFSYVQDSMLMVVAGELSIGYQGRSHSAATGSLVLLPASERVNLRGVPGIAGLQIDSVQIPDAVMESFERQHRALLHGMVDADRPEQIVFPRNNGISRLWEQLTRTVDENQPGAMIDHWIQGLLLQLLLDGWTLPYLSRHDQSLRRQVERLLGRDIAHDWSATEVAATMGMSEPTLRRRLAAEGSSYRALLEDARMSHALEMLMASNMPIGHVAHAVGYLSASRFSSRFTARYGITPRMLRSVRSEPATRL